MTLFSRDWRVTIGTLEVSAPMRVSFDVTRTLSDQASKAKVQIWNLTRDHQGMIENARKAQVVVEAGYKDDRGLGVIFAGEIFRASGRHKPASDRVEGKGADAISHIEARDGGFAFRDARVSQSYGPGASIETVVTDCARAMALGLGNLEEVLSESEFIAGGTDFPMGTVVSGQASGELTRLLRSLGISWSVQHGVIQAIPRGRRIQSRAVRLSSNSGMIGSPEPKSDSRVKVVSLLTPEIWPGRRVVVDSEFVHGAYTCESVRFQGDSHGNDWLVEAELISPQTRTQSEITNEGIITGDEDVELADVG